MKIEWRQDLTTDNPDIDDQHRKLFEKINDLIAACKERRQKSEIVTLLSFLKSYVGNHFSAEEQYQVRHGFPNQKEHKEQHAALIRRLELIDTEYSGEGITLPVVTNSLMLTYQWLTDHILREDLQMARYCHNGSRQA